MQNVFDQHFTANVVKRYFYPRISFPSPSPPLFKPLRLQVVLKLACPETSYFIVLALSNNLKKQLTVK